MRLKRPPSLQSLWRLIMFGGRISRSTRHWITLGVRFKISFLNHFTKLVKVLLAICFRSVSRPSCSASLALTRHLFESDVCFFLFNIKSIGPYPRLWQKKIEISIVFTELYNGPHSFGKEINRCFFFPIIFTPYHNLRYLVLWKLPIKTFKTFF